MVRLIVLVGLMGMVACQPLYGGKPEKLSNPKPKKKPDQPAVAEAPLKYVEDCNANFRDDPKKLSRDTTGSQDLVVKGDETLAQADKTKEPQAQGSLVSTAIDSTSTRSARTRSTPMRRSSSRSRTTACSAKAVR